MHAKLNTLVTVATNHSEYCAGSKAGREAKWLRKIFEFLGFDHIVQPIDLYSDSQGAIAMAYNPTNRAASKHIDLADHYVRAELQERGIITITWVSTANMIADLLKGKKPRTPMRPLSTLESSSMTPIILLLKCANDVLKPSYSRQPQAAY